MSSATAEQPAASSALPRLSPGFVATCVRATDLRARVDALSGRIERDELALSLSRADEAAIEHGLRLAEQAGIDLVVLCAGPPSAEAVLREVAALGVAVLRIECGDTVSSGDERAYLEELAIDEHRLARVLASVIEELGEVRFVLCGDASADRNTGALPAFLAHELGAAQGLGLVALALEGERLVGERRLDGGRREHIALAGRALCSIEAAGTRLRRAPLEGALAAATASIPVRRVVPVSSSWQAPRLLGARPLVPRPRVIAPPSGDHRARLLALTGALETHEAPTVLGPLDANEAADALLGFLERNSYWHEAGASDEEDR